MVAFSFYAAAAVAASFAIAAPSSTSLSARHDLVERICPLICPDGETLKPPCRCVPDPPSSSGLEKKMCDLYCPYGYTDASHCDCLDPPVKPKRSEGLMCELYCPYGYTDAGHCACLDPPAAKPKRSEANHHRRRTVYCPQDCVFGYDPTAPPCTCLPGSISR